MSTPVLNALQNAKANLETLGRLGASSIPIFTIVYEQLKNGVTALENGMRPDDIIQNNLVSEVKLTR